MKFYKTILVLLGAILPLTTAIPAPPSLDQGAEVIPGKYIVTLKQDISEKAISAHTSWVEDIHRVNIAKRDPAEGTTVGIETTYSGNFVGYAGGFDDETISQIRNSKDVAAVEADQTWHLFQSCQPSAPWGLASLQSRTPGATCFRPDLSSGASTYAYVVDTGINTGNAEFQGRAIFGYNAVGGSNDDTVGHGTHAAGIIGARTYGVARAATLVAVKVFSGSSGSLSTVLNGYNWAANNIVQNGRQSRALINLSAGGAFSQSFNQAVANAYGQGIATVAAAGNGNVDANGTSPASAPEAITVGAHDINWVRASFSNFGPAVDVFAPGVQVPSTGTAATGTPYVLSGTSVAAPHVAGVALYLMSTEGESTPARLASRIVSIATMGRLGNPGAGSPNRIANMGLDRA